MGNLTSALQELRAERKQAAVAGREVGSSDCSDRVVKRFASVQHRKSADPNHIGSFAAENGAGAKSEMGKGS